MGKAISKIGNKIFSIILSLVLIIIAFVGGFLTHRAILGQNPTLASDLVLIMEKVGYVYDENTGELREITKSDVGNALTSGILDKYSKYYTKQEYQEILKNSSGNYGGIGVSYYDEEDLIVDKIPMNSPLYNLGVRAGDKIVSGVKDGNEVNFSTVNDVITFISAFPLDEDMRLTYERDGNQEQVLVRKENYVASYVYYCDNEKQLSFVSQGQKAPTKKVESLSNSPIKSSDVGYIKLDGFEGGAVSQMRQALAFMQVQGKTKLILDLRDNGGGYMNVFCDIASFFIDNDGAKKSLVAYSKGKQGTESYYTNSNNFCGFIESMCVLANKNTASASECLIGAIVCYKDLVSGIENVIVEKDDDGIAKSYGKGIMQTTYKLLDGGAFKLTTAKLWWPDNETCIHGTGITEQLGATVSEKGNSINKAQEIFEN